MGLVLEATAEGMGPPSGTGGCCWALVRLMLDAALESRGGCST